ncbi:hypothetical protein GT755_08485 [Herbidospora sp. NEAU-GS84]|uniref:Uncharacterized protein n=1 Tax=Herbidospora solisilvae TaxID=2696284 RepID=A0A7C9JBE9_9ACTN|nr:hypothetical protein [Herbidospora solisilvae]NAS21721.1 hypothetical protein [Herbidospora solisilvae]
MGDSAARILDAAPARDQDTGPAADLTETPAYRTELAVRTGEPDRARASRPPRTWTSGARPAPSSNTADSRAARTDRLEAGA